ncbi:hypothetical protein Bca4012_010551 [Brassica carinata]
MSLKMILTNRESINTVLWGLISVLASSYFERPQEKEDTFKDHIKDEPYVEPPPFDASILTLAQRVKLYELQKKNPWTTKRSLAQDIRIDLIGDLAELEGREVTQYEFDVAYNLKEVMYWVPPTQLEGICNSTLELHFEDICLPCVEDVASNLNSHVLIIECLDQICETRKLDDLRIAKLVRDQIEVYFTKNYLYASMDLESEFLMLDEPRPLLELADLGNELDVDKLLFEIENPFVKNFHENENIVFYLIDGDRVDYFVKTSFEPVFEFVFLPNSFDSHDRLNLKENFMIHVISLVKLFDEKSVYFLWTAVWSFAYLVSCSCRRRTKGALAQPFDTYDKQAHKVKLETKNKLTWEEVPCLSIVYISISFFLLGCLISIVEVFLVGSRANKRGRAAKHCYYRHPLPYSNLHLRYHSTLSLYIPLLLSYFWYLPLSYSHRDYVI